MSTVVTEDAPVRGKPCKKRPSSGPIMRGAIYTQDEFLRRTRWSVHAFKTARRNGLLAFVQGNISFILGDDFIDWMKSQAAKQGQSVLSPQSEAGVL